MGRTNQVLIISDDPVFARDLVGRWKQDPGAPELGVVSTEFIARAGNAGFDLAVVGPLRAEHKPKVLQWAGSLAHPVICVLDTAAQAQQVHAGHPRVLAMSQHEGWPDTLLLLAEECLQRVDLAERVRKAELAAADQARNAALGRYVLDMRHDFNNSLTSVLGNAELLLLDEAPLPVTVREQLETVHNMALHMHGMMQRFSSLASEMQRSEKKSQDETLRLSHAVAGDS